PGSKRASLANALGSKPSGFFASVSAKTGHDWPTSGRQWHDGHVQSSASNRWLQARHTFIGSKDTISAPSSLMRRFVPFNRPRLTGCEYERIREAMDSRRLSSGGPFTLHCQEWLERHVGCRRAFLTHSATGALEMA